MDREIKVTKCGKWEDNDFNDRISIELSPFEVSELEEVFLNRALNAEDYVEQTSERGRYELFREARKIWRKERKEKDK